MCCCHITATTRRNSCAALRLWNAFCIGAATSAAAIFQARQDFPNCVPIGNQVCHAVGVAYAFKLRREARVTVCIIGDGGTSKGDFYEPMNLAGVWRAPVVFVINNNQWAISAPRNIQTAAQTLAQKGIAAGIEGPARRRCLPQPAKHLRMWPNVAKMRGVLRWNLPRKTSRVAKLASVLAKRSVPSYK